jgi:hypothetical protein
MRPFALVIWLSFFALGRAQLANDDWCGRGGGALLDAWTQTWIELEALEEIPFAEAWTNVPARYSRLLRNTTLLHRASAEQGSEVLGKGQVTVQALSSLRAKLLGASTTHDLNGYTQILAQVRFALKELERSYAPAALRAPPAAKVSLARPSLAVSAKLAPVVIGQPTIVKIRLQDEAGRGVSSLNLMESHTRKLHAFLIDPTLEDYHHEHPITAGGPGIFEFSFTPRKAGDYVLWLDVMPEATGRNEYPRTVLPGAAQAAGEPSFRTQMDFAAHGFHYELRLQPALVKAGQDISARLRVTDEKGRPCFRLEPVMGAFAHIVGIMDDRKTILHVHSHGESPREHERSGPEVLFRLVAPKAGYLKLFVQTQVDGRLNTAAFTLPVE